MELTFVIISCGETTLNKCVASLQVNKGEFTIKFITDVYPQSKANNLAVSIVETPFFVFLDADILLHVDATERIYAAISEWDDQNRYQVLFPLWDTLTQTKIMAVKLVNTAIMKQHPYSDSRVPDVEHFHRMDKLGFKVINLYDQVPIGDHMITGQKFCYLRYKDRYMMLRNKGLDKQEIVKIGENETTYFKNRFIESNSEDYLCCLAGIYDGITAKVGLDQSKDIREPLVVPPEKAIGLLQHYFKVAKSGL